MEGIIPSAFFGFAWEKDGGSAGAVKVASFCLTQNRTQQNPLFMRYSFQNIWRMEL